MAKIIKNIDTVDHTYAGQTIIAGGEYTVAFQEQITFASDNDLLVDIALGKAQINNGMEDISGVANQLDFIMKCYG
jgi:hypothetical protein